MESFSHINIWPNVHMRKDKSNWQTVWEAI